MNNLESFLDTLYEESTIDYVECQNDAVVLIPKEVERTIASQYNNIEEGRLFERKLKIEDLKEVIRNITPLRDAILYETEYKDVGYDFILPRRNVVRYKKLIGYNEEKMLKEEVEINKAVVPKPIDEFKTNTISIQLKNLNKEQTKEKFDEFADKAAENKLFIVENVFPGKSWIDGKPIPPFKQWKDDIFIVIPEELNK